MNVNLLEFDKKLCKIYGEKFSLLKKSCKMTEGRDLMIASMTLARNLTLVTKTKSTLRAFLT